MPRRCLTTQLDPPRRSPSKRATLFGCSKDLIQTGGMARSMEQTALCLTSTYACSQTTMWTLQTGMEMSLFPASYHRHPRFHLVEWTDRGTSMCLLGFLRERDRLEEGIVFLRPHLIMRAPQERVLMHHPLERLRLRRHPRQRFHRRIL